MRAQFVCGVSVLALASTFGGQAVAQSTEVRVSEVEEVVVTAQRREERLMEVPMAVTAVTAQELDVSGAVTTRDLGQLAPGLTSTTNGKAFQPTIRGVSSTGTSAGDEQNVALYIDGVYMAAATGNAFNLKNIERIEVLKGPQGTLFGRNATGGAIQVITKDPGRIPEFRASASYGTELKSRDFSVYGAMPLGDTLSIGIAGNVYDDDGYVKQLIPGWKSGDFAQTHSWIGRAKLVWTPTDNFKATLAGDLSRYQSDNMYALAPVNGLNALRNNPAVIMPDEPWEISSNLKPTLNNRTGGVSVTLEYELPKYTLTSITARRTNHTYGILDNDRVNIISSVAQTGDTLKWFTQEGLIASNYDGPLNFIAGVFYYDAEGSAESNGYTNGPNAGPGGELIDLGTPGTFITGYVDTKSVAAFGEVTYEITDALKVIGGLRYTTETKNLLTDPVRPDSPQLTDEETWNNWSYRLTGQYDITPDVNVYATYSTGFKSGAYNATSRTFVQRVEPETVDAFEVGMKGRFATIFDVTAAAYSYKYDNIQVQSNNYISGVSQIVLTNAAKAEIAGGEVELGARVTPDLRLKIGAAWLPTAEYTTYLDGLDSVPKGYPGSLDPSLCPGVNCGVGNDQIIRDLSGTRVIRSPEFTFNAGVDYSREFAAGAFGATANYFYTSDFYWVTGEHIAQPSYSIVNGTLSWTPTGEHYRFTLFGRNLTNEAYGIYASPNAQGVAMAWAAPREIGFSIDVQF